MALQCNPGGPQSNRIETVVTSKRLLYQNSTQAKCKRGELQALNVLSSRKVQKVQKVQELAMKFLEMQTSDPGNAKIILTERFHVQPASI